MILMEEILPKAKEEPPKLSRPSSIKTSPFSMVIEEFAFAILTPNRLLAQLTSLPHPQFEWLR
jgi:hypothetical protein